MQAGWAIVNVKTGKIYVKAGRTKQTSVGKRYLSIFIDADFIFNQTQLFGNLLSSMIENQNESVKDLDRLIHECCREDRSAQSSLYNLLAPRMFVVCLRYSKSREEAEEILQEGFMKVFKSIRQFKFSGSFEGWVRRIMINCALQKLRRKSHLHAIIPIDATPVEPFSNEEILSRLGTKELLNVVQQLPSAYRLVFNLYVFEGMKHREIAELLGISEGTSKSNLSDARSILQKAIRERLDIPSKNIGCL